MIENISREDVEAVLQRTIADYNNSSNENNYVFNIFVDDELVDKITVPGYLARFYRSNPTFIEVTGNPIFD